MATYALQIDGRIVKVKARSKQAAIDKAVEQWQDRRAGIVARRRNRETGTTILLVDRDMPGPAQRPDADDPMMPTGDKRDERWETMCEDHGKTMGHATRGEAVAFMAEPTSWCEDCQAAHSTDGAGSWDDFA